MSAPAPRPPRDAQRSRLYRAETPLPGRRFRELTQCAEFADHAVGSLWWTARFPHLGLDAVPRLRPGHGARQAFYRVDPDGPTITLPRRYRTASVVLHELAHWALDDQPDLPHHGRTFARLLLDATTEFAGDARAAALLASFERERVRVGRPARLGPDGRWRYGWDERLRLGRGRSLAIHVADAAPIVGVYEVSERSGSVLVMRANGRTERVVTRAVWDVQPV